MPVRVQTEHFGRFAESLNFALEAERYGQTE